MTLPSLDVPPGGLPRPEAAGQARMIELLETLVEQQRHTNELLEVVALDVQARQAAIDAHQESMERIRQTTAHLQRG